MVATKRITERKFLGDWRLGGREPFFLIAGPCTIESQDLIFKVCEAVQEICAKLGIHYIFKSSFDKANRSSGGSRRGPGIDEGLRLLSLVKERFGVPVLTDVHETQQVPAVAQAVDVLQIPAFLSRQTDLIIACGKTDCWVNVKKGQFMAPQDCQHIKGKMQEANSERLLITERGASFGYNNLVFDPRSPEILHEFDLPVVFDATHSTQLPGGGAQSGGDRRFVPVLARAATAAGIEGLFMEVHPDPANAWSDAAVQFPLSSTADLLTQLVRLDGLMKEDPSA